MHRFYLRAIALLCVIAMLPLLSGCKTDTPKYTTDSGEKYCTISFNSNGGTPVESIQVLSGHHATKPEDPLLDNYIFCRWETPDGKTWFFDTKKAENDITLEAVWIKAELLFELEPVPDTSNIVITKIKLQEEFSRLNIPSVINGKTVVGIGDSAFEAIHSSYASNIVFPNSITSIGAAAFKDISSDVSVTFNGAITYLGESAFENSACISQITLGDGLQSIPYRAFASCTALETIIIPSGVSLIDENAFDNCTSLVTIVIPETLTTINDSAFKGCSTLKTIFYSGSSEQFSLEISKNNDCFEAARVYFYSEQEPSVKGDYWHYGKNGIPTIW